MNLNIDISTNVISKLKFWPQFIFYYTHKNSVYIFKNAICQVDLWNVNVNDVKVKIYIVCHCKKYIITYFRAKNNF